MKYLPYHSDIWPTGTKGQIEIMGSGDFGNYKNKRWSDYYMPYNLVLFIITKAITAIPVEEGNYIPFLQLFLFPCQCYSY